MTINYPVVLEVGDRVYAINEYGYSNIYVIVGTKRALVIDTGAGCFSLRALVRRLTFLPYDVVLTHGHIGQGGGIGQFDNIFAYTGEYGRAMSVSKVDSMAFCGEVQKRREPGIWLDAMPKDDIWEKIPIINELYEGYVFDLGDRQVATIRTSSHTYGSCSFIDSKSRIAFVGDACNRRMDIRECCVTSAIRGLYNLWDKKDMFDRIMSANTGEASVTEVCSIPVDVLFQCITACRGILHNNVSIEPVPGQENLFVAKYQDVQVLYDRNKIYEGEEEPLPI